MITSFNLCARLREFSTLSLPIIVRNTMLCVRDNIGLLTFAFLMDDALIAAVGIANTLMCSISYPLIYGTNSALAPLIAHAYGRKDYRACGTYINQGIFVTSFMFIPVFFLLLNSERLFILLGIEENVAYEAAKFC